MVLPRRAFLRLSAGAATIPLMAKGANAQVYPSRPVNIIVGFPPDSGVTALARLFAQWLSERLGQPFNVENRLGAGTNIATEAVVRAPPDGYTLLLASAANAINRTLYKSTPFNFVDDIAPIAGLTRIPVVMVVGPSFPAKTVAEFISHARANPGKLRMASSFVGSPPHLCAKLFEVMTGLNVPHVEYRSDGAALIDLLAGDIQIVFASLGTAIPKLGTALEHIRSGRLHAIAVTSSTRSELLPNTPTVAEFVANYQHSSWFGIGAPKNTPQGIVDTLNKAINAGLADTKIKTRLVESAFLTMPMSPAEFGKFVADETERFSKVIKRAGIKPI